MASWRAATIDFDSGNLSFRGGPRAIPVQILILFSVPALMTKISKDPKTKHEFLKPWIKQWIKNY